jgi:AcrR family transcriptional regulator
MVENTKGEKTKKRIIECAAKIFLTNGYNNTGINDILLETNLPKGSFYYHFQNKKHLAIEVANYFKEKIGLWLLEVSKNRNWKEFVEIFMEQIIKDAKDENYFGCPFAVLGSEIAFLDSEIVDAYSSPMKNLIYLFSRVLEFSRVPKEEINDKANHAFALFEGYIIYFRITKDIKVLEILKEQLLKIVVL